METQTTQAPHNAVKAEALSVFAGSRCLLKNTEFSIAEQSRMIDVKSSSGSVVSMKSGACYGLVGPNGCGKSTLLRLIADGCIPVPSSWDVFLVGQHLPQAAGHSPIEEVLSADAKRAELLKLQSTLEEEMGELAEGDVQLFTQANDRLMEVTMELDRWDEAASEVTSILLALGFRKKDCTGRHRSEPSLETPMDHLSGGWRMKVELAKALWLKPKLLLLDEPTNHLDFQSLHWLESRLEEYPHTVVVVSHDVTFLHSTCREILWIVEQRVESMPRDLVTEDDLARMQRRKPPAFHFDVPESDSPGDHGLSFHKVTFNHGLANEGVAKDLRNWVPSLLKIPGEVRFSGNSRSVILGRNGSGKSTFLDLCTGKLNPTRGTVDRTPGLKVAHYSQQTEDLDRYPDDSAAAYLVRHCRDALVARSSARSTHTSRACAAEGRAAKSSATAVEKRLVEAARGVLSQFGFDGDLAINVPLHRLSGGQKACLKFAVLSLQPAHILLLDEPTNHLDAEACESLARALSDFKGGIVVVTHDETLIYRLIQCNWADGELLICEGGGIRREQNIGAQRLNTLKEQVRKAEGTTSSAMKPQRIQKKQNVGKSSERTTFRQAEKQTNKDASLDSEACSHPATAINTLCRSQLLAFRFAVDDYPAVIQDSPAVTAIKETICPDVTVAISNQESPEATVEISSKEGISSEPTVEICNQEQVATISLDLPKASVSLASKGASSHIDINVAEHGKEDVPDDWEEHANSSAPTDVPDNWEEYDSSSPPTPKGSSVENMPVLPESDASPEASSLGTSQSSSAPALHVTVEALLDSSSKEGGGHRSRLRKNLVNLNKAVSKWIRKEKAGEMSKSQVIETIRASKVLIELRHLHGPLFREDEFIHKLYTQRDVEAVEKALVPVPRALDRKSSGPPRLRAHRCG